MGEGSATAEPPELWAVRGPGGVNRPLRPLPTLDLARGGGEGVGVERQRRRLGGLRLRPGLPFEGAFAFRGNLYVGVTLLADSDQSDRPVYSREKLVGDRAALVEDELEVDAPFGE